MKDRSIIFFKFIKGKQITFYENNICIIDQKGTAHKIENLRITLKTATLRLDILICEIKNLRSKTKYFCVLFSRRNEICNFMNLIWNEIPEIRNWKLFRNLNRNSKSETHFVRSRILDSPSTALAFRCRSPIFSVTWF